MKSHASWLCHRTLCHRTRSISRNLCHETFFPTKRKPGDVGWQTFLPIKLGCIMLCGLPCVMARNTLHKYHMISRKRLGLQCGTAFTRLQHHIHLHIHVVTLASISFASNEIKQFPQVHHLLYSHNGQ